MDLRYTLIKERLSTLSKEELQRILDNIDDICFDDVNYDEKTHQYCPLAMGMGLNTIEAPTDNLIKEEIAKRFNPVNVIKGIPGAFYRENRKQDLIDLCRNLLTM